MKKTFLILFAALVAASFSQAAEVKQQPETPRYVLTQERLTYIANRLGAIAAEEIARSAPKSAYNPTIANNSRGKVQPQPNKLERKIETSSS